MASEMKNSFPCSKCRANFKFHKNLRAHFKKRHPACPLPSLPHSSALISAIPSFQCASCKSSFFNQKCLVVHIRDAHGVEMEIENFEFVNIESFNCWRGIVEQETKSRFIKTRGSRQYSSHEKISFTCFRSGYFNHNRSKGLRHFKTQRRPSCKINATCPASMTLKKLKDGKCQVTFIKTHYGHDADLVHLTTNKKDCSSNASKIAKIPFQAISNEMTETILVLQESVGHQYLGTRKDLHNIEQCFNLNNDGVRHDTDCLQPSGAPRIEGLQDDSCSTNQGLQDDVTKTYFLVAVGPNNHTEAFEARKVKLLKYFEDLVESATTHEELEIIEKALKPIKPTMKGFMSILDLCSVQNQDGTNKPSTALANSTFSIETYHEMPISYTDFKVINCLNEHNYHKGLGKKKKYSYIVSEDKGD